MRYDTGVWLLCQQTMVMSSLTASVTPGLTCLSCHMRTCGSALNIVMEWEGAQHWVHLPTRPGCGCICSCAFGTFSHHGLEPKVDCRHYNRRRRGSRGCG